MQPASPKRGDGAAVVVPKAPYRIARPVLVLGCSMLTFGALMVFLALDAAWRQRPDMSPLDAFAASTGQLQMLQASLFVCTAAIIWSMHMAELRDHQP